MALSCFAYRNVLTHWFPCLSGTTSLELHFICYYNRQNMTLVAETPSLTGRKTEVRSRKDQNRGMFVGRKVSLGQYSKGSLLLLPYILCPGFHTHISLRIHLNSKLHFF